MTNSKGLIIVHTGNGKGKTTAALGLALRAWGQGMSILIAQFIKGGWQYGELKALEQLAPNLQIRQMGEGFVSKNSGDDLAKHQQLAQTALAEVRRELLSGKFDMIILDEINYAVKFGLVSSEAVLELLSAKPSGLHLVLTGRDALNEVIEQADLVTEMKEVKHPYKQGIKAQPGIEF